MRERVAQIRKSDSTVTALKAIPCVEQVFDSETNYLWFALPPPVPYLNLYGIRALSYVIKINNLL